MNERRIAQLQDGHAPDFSRVFKTFYKPLCYFAYSLTGSETEAEDIATESLLKLWRQQADFKDEHHKRAFLYRVVKNACLDYLKRKKRKLPHCEAYNYFEGIQRQQEETENYISAQIVKAEVLQVIYRKIDELPDRCRSVFILSYVEGLKNDEIASMLNLSYHTVKAQKARGLKMLRLLLPKAELLALLEIIFRHV